MFNNDTLNGEMVKMVEGLARKGMVLPKDNRVK
jgi:hypothetical protein